MKIAMISRPGGKNDCVDSIGCQEKNGLRCFVIADGGGETGGGRYASATAANGLLSAFMEKPDISYDFMYDYMDAAQDALIRDPEFPKELSTTIAALVTDGEQAVWAHCGDSRIYSFKKHRIQTVTDDQTEEFEKFRDGKTRYDEIRGEDRRLTSCLSDGSRFRPDVQPVRKLPKKSSFLMCTDGLWRYVNESFMEKSLKKSATPKEWLQALLKERRANAPEDPDDYSAIAVFI
ncbi:MAG: PP2C family protein-serine/threonine phosphatase [Candidatus Ornithomonoglobus sp.]